MVLVYEGLIQPCEMSSAWNKALIVSLLEVISKDKISGQDGSFLRELDGGRPLRTRLCSMDLRLISWARMREWILSTTVAMTA